MLAIKTDYSRLTDEELEQATVKLARHEQETTIKVIDHLHEIQCRMLHAKRGHQSLFQYCKEVLGYSEPAAGERIAAMRFVFTVPGARDKLEKGSLSISSAARVHRHLKWAEKNGADIKKAVHEGFIKKEAAKTGEAAKASEGFHADLLHLVAGKSVRETENVLYDLLPEGAPPKEYLRRAQSGYDFHVRISEEIVSKLNRAKEIAGTQTWAEVLEKALQSYISTKEKERTVSTRTSESGPTHKIIHSRHVPQANKVIIWKRSGGRCEYIDPKTGTRCAARSRLELDHVFPYAAGGEHGVDNLQLLCKTHNRLAAMLFYGEGKLDHIKK